MSDLAVPCYAVLCCAMLFGLILPTVCVCVCVCVCVQRRYTEQLAEGFLELEKDVERRGLPDCYYTCLVKARLKETPSLESGVIGTVGE